MPGASAGNARAARVLARILPFPIPAHGIAGRGQRPVSGIVTPDEAEVRWALVTSARARLAAGYYDRPNVRWRIADAVLREIQPS